MVHKQIDNSKVQKFALGAAIAAVVGYIAGILTAPQSGKETRQDIKDTSRQAITQAEKELKVLHTQINDLVNEARERGVKLSDKAKVELDSLVAKASDSKQKAREMISGIHEGDADDKDLLKAITEAQAAVEHLKTYLKK